MRGFINVKRVIYRDSDVEAYHKALEEVENTNENLGISVGSEEDVEPPVPFIVPFSLHPSVVESYHGCFSAGEALNSKPKFDTTLVTTFDAKEYEVYGSYEKFEAAFSRAISEQLDIQRKTSEMLFKTAENGKA